MRAVITLLVLLLALSACGSPSEDEGAESVPDSGETDVLDEDLAELERGLEDLALTEEDLDYSYAELD
jgi:hypothetical protein